MTNIEGLEVHYADSLLEAASIRCVFLHLYNYEFLKVFVDPPTVFSCDLLR